MNEEIIVAVFAAEADAEAATRDLQAAGVPDGAISRHSGLDTVPGYSVPNADAPDAPRSGFWSRLFGAPPQPASGEEHQGGGAILVVHATDTHAAGIITILERHELIDLDERFTGVQLSSPQTTSPDARCVPTS